MDDLADTDPTTAEPDSDVTTNGELVAQPTGDAEYRDLAGADGRRRRRTALAVVGAALLAGGAGMWIGSRIESPADRAARREAPTPSLVTVPVERRQLTSQVVLSGEVDYNEPLTVTLAGAVGLDAGETAVVTELREAGTELQEGDVVIEVTARPVFVLQGELPMYRRLVVGTEGTDVAQLEQALERLGYAPGTVDTVFDAATASAVEQMYSDAGYTAEGPSAEQRTALTAARDAVTAAEGGVVDAQTALAQAERPIPESQRLQLEQAVDSARDAIPAAQAAAQSTRVEQDQVVADARAARDTAQTTRDAAATVRDAAGVPGAIDPDTGEPYTPERIAALDVAAAQAQEAYTQSEGQLAVAEQTRSTAVANADAAIETARGQLQIAEAQLAEATAAADTARLQEAVTNAQTALASAQAEVAELEASAGTRISPGEIVFAPVLPATLTESFLALGSTVSGPVGVLATTDTLVRARVARADAGLVAVGADVEIEIRDAGITMSGTVLSVGEPRQQPGDGQEGRPGGASESGRMEVVVAPEPGSELGNYMFFGARVRVPIDATDGEVLVVPVAALTVGPDEVSQVEVERAPATDDSPAETELVAVTVGLTANGLAEVAPIEAGALEEGDRVVIGVDNHLLPGNADDDDAPADTSGDGSGDGGDDGDGEQGDGNDGDGEQGDGNDGGDDGQSASPLAELMGWVSDPVEQRRQELEIQERIVECMQAEGWEYTPFDWSAQMPETDVDMSDPEAYGEKYGYGVMYNYETYEVGSGDGGGGIGIEDPNMEYMNSLSPADQEAYNAALYGDPGIWDAPAVEGSMEGSVDASIPMAPPLDQQGCQGKARLEVVGEDPSSDPEVQRMLEDFWQSQQNDPGLDSIVAEWIECFQPKLDEYAIETTPKNIFDGYQIMEGQKYTALGAEVVPVANQAEMDEYFNSGENVLSAYGDENGAGYVVIAPAGELPELTGDQIDELTAMELDLWKADHACQEQVGYAEFTRQQEQALVDQLISQFPELGS
jgi:multidrug efflux pump subunit AcrA (membrane-fusion protein)